MGLSCLGPGGGLGRRGGRALQFGTGRAEGAYLTPSEAATRESGLQVWSLGKRRGLGRRVWEPSLQTVFPAAGLDGPRGGEWTMQRGSGGRCELRSPLCTAGRPCAGSRAVGTFQGGNCQPHAMCQAGRGPRTAIRRRKSTRDSDSRSPRRRPAPTVSPIGPCCPPGVSGH